MQGMGICQKDVVSSCDTCVELLCNVEAGKVEFLFVEKYEQLIGNSWKDLLFVLG